MGGRNFWFLEGVAGGMKGLRCTGVSLYGGLEGIIEFIDPLKTLGGGFVEYWIDGSHAGAEKSLDLVVRGVDKSRGREAARGV